MGGQLGGWLPRGATSFTETLSFNPHREGLRTVPILQKKKLRRREGKWLAQGSGAIGSDSRPSSLSAQPASHRPSASLGRILLVWKDESLPGGESFGWPESASQLVGAERCTDTQQVKPVKTLPPTKPVESVCL